MKANGKIAVVTGAGSGIGRAGRAGPPEGGVRRRPRGRRREPLEGTIAAAGRAGTRARAVVADVTDPDSVDALFEATRASFGRLDLLFNNAGTGAPAVPLEDLTIEQWRRVVDVNLTGAFLCTQAAFRLMKDQPHAADGSSTTARSRHRSRGRTRPPTPPPSTRSPG